MGLCNFPFKTKNKQNKQNRDFALSEVNLYSWTATEGAWQKHHLCLTPVFHHDLSIALLPFTFAGILGRRHSFPGPFREAEDSRFQILGSLAQAHVKSLSSLQNVSPLLEPTPAPSGPPLAEERDEREERN